MVAQFVAKILQVLVAQTAFEVSAPVDARRGVALKVNQVARLIAKFRRVDSETPIKLAACFIRK